MRWIKYAGLLTSLLFSAMLMWDMYLHYQRAFGDQTARIEQRDWKLRDCERAFASPDFALQCATLRAMTPLPTANQHAVHETVQIMLLKGFTLLNSLWGFAVVACILALVVAYGSLRAHNRRAGARGYLELSADTAWKLWEAAGPDPPKQD